ncbi:hypothetical protein [Synechococcus sp. MIT S9220]|uniref:hypothetical protein n=1 Tax=Synechococcus sp. MIT S9220 TaxID=166309 RepID=UPI00164C9646|nr:hypothetical protein [Synechococcus sp. MIT S9220]
MNQSTLERRANGKTYRAGVLVFLLTIFGSISIPKAKAHFDFGCDKYELGYQYNIEHEDFDWDKWQKCLKRSAKNAGFLTCEEGWQSSTYRGPCIMTDSKGIVRQTEVVRRYRHMYPIPFVHPIANEGNCRGNSYDFYYKQIAKDYANAHPNIVSKYVRGHDKKARQLNQTFASKWRQSCMRESCKFKPMPPYGPGWQRIGFFGQDSAKNCFDTFVRLASRRGSQIEIDFDRNFRYGSYNVKSYLKQTSFVRCNSWESLSSYGSNWRPIQSNTAVDIAAKKFCA